MAVGVHNNTFDELITVGGTNRYVQSLLNRHQSSRHPRTLSVVNRYVGDLQPMPRVCPELSGSSDPQHGSQKRDDTDALRHHAPANAPPAPAGRALPSPSRSMNSSA